MRLRVTPLAIVFAVIGVLLVIVGIIYLTVAAKDLPAFIPGQVDHVTHTRNRRGAVALVLGIGSLLVAFVAAYLAGRSAKREVTQSS